MGLLDMMLGNAKEVDLGVLQRELAEIMVSGEVVQQGFKVIRDLFVFTNKRLLLVDKQGLTGKKVEYMTIPYRSIEAFSVETAGHFDRDSELKLHVRGMGLIEKQLKKGIDAKAICRTIAFHMLP